MGIFRQFPYSNFHEMNLDWILEQINKLKEKWEEFVVDWDDNLKEEVNEWLTDHPEYTTTVMDNSITSIKLHNESIPFYNVQDYGILGGNEDQYEALHALLKDKVFNTGGIVFFPAGKYIISDTIFIPENTMFIGEGESSEIYFDESYTRFGVGLSNAGSNVTITNLKVTQKTKGIFHIGAQPGCIGFSNNSREMARSDLHTTNFIRAAASNLTARNIYTDNSFYIIQTENNNESEVSNIIYENIHAPRSCVSVMSGTANLSNVYMNNIDADLLRVAWRDNGGYFKNISINNVTCQTMVFNVRNALTPVEVNNLYQTLNTRKNDYRREQYSGVVDGDLIFNNCIFQSRSEEVDGLALAYGIRKFNNCVFNAADKISTRLEVASENTNYDVITNCILNDGNNRGTTLIGYGNNNIYNGNITNMLWGDTHRVVTPGRLFTKLTPVTSSVPTMIKIENKTISLDVYVQITNTAEIAILNQTGINLINIDANNVIPVIIFNSSTPTETINTFAAFDNGTLKVLESPYANSSAYNRAKINAILPIKKTPSPLTARALLL